MWVNEIASPWLARAGDVALFNRNGIYNKLIAVKTWSRFTHCEVFVEQMNPDGVNLKTFTSRNGLGKLSGVNVYEPDFNGLAMVLRLDDRITFDQAKAWEWAKTTIGQKYDLVGLVAFFWAKRQGIDNGAMFCSEACARFLRKGGADVFRGADADTIAPRDFSVNALLRPVWLSQDEAARYNEGEGDE